MCNITFIVSSFGIFQILNVFKQLEKMCIGEMKMCIRDSYYTPRKRVAIIEPSEGSPAAEIGLKAGDIIMAVSYTHLDVYKRQVFGTSVYIQCFTIHTSGEHGFGFLA